MKRFLTVLVASLFLASAAYAAEEKAKVEEKKAEAKEKAKVEAKEKQEKKAEAKEKAKAEAKEKQEKKAEAKEKAKAEAKEKQEKKAEAKEKAKAEAKEKQEKKAEAKEKAKSEREACDQVRSSSLPEGRWPLPTFPIQALERLLPNGEFDRAFIGRHWFNLVSKNVYVAAKPSVLPCFRKTTENALRFFLTVPTT